MAGEVNAVDSVKVGTPTPAGQPARVVEQEEEQMFEFEGSSALEMGYNIARELSEYTAIGALKKVVNGESIIPENTKDIVPEGVKEFIHENAEKIREAKKENPILSWFYTGGILGTAVTWLDEQINK